MDKNHYNSLQWTCKPMLSPPQKTLCHPARQHAPRYSSSCSARTTYLWAVHCHKLLCVFARWSLSAGLRNGQSIPLQFVLGVLDFATTLSRFLHGFVSSGMWEFYIFSLSDLCPHSKEYTACKKCMLSTVPSQPLRKLTRPNLSTGLMGCGDFQREWNPIWRTRKASQKHSFNLWGGSW